MTKGKWYTRAISVTLALSFILGSLVVASPVAADPGTSTWEKQATPTEKDLVILPGSDIIDMAVGGSDGKTLYAIGVWSDWCAEAYSGYFWAQEPGPSDFFGRYHHPKLWKSTDGGISWKDRTSKVLDANNLPDLDDAWTDDAEDFAFFTTVAVAPDDPNFVVVGGWGWDDEDLDGDGRNYVPVVVGSSDGAEKFYWMGCGNAVGFITCLDVSIEVNGKRNIAVGTWDWELESPTYLNNNAAVWRYEAGGYWSGAWVDASGTYGGWLPMDVILDLKFSPNFDVDNTIVVLGIGDVVDTAFPAGLYPGFWVQNGMWGNLKKWNSEGGFSAPLLISRDNDLVIAPLLPGGLGRRTAHAPHGTSCASVRLHGRHVQWPQGHGGC
ncbi:MAG: hypothetical protein GX600_11520 [Dehalococcoidia bacterium]|nr:hypothetical protein [Dehalococcoidia bacterium]